MDSNLTLFTRLFLLLLFYCYIFYIYIALFNLSSVFLFLFIRHKLELSTVKFRRPSCQSLCLCWNWSLGVKPVLSPHAHALPPQSHLPSAPAALIPLASFCTDMVSAWP